MTHRLQGNQRVSSFQGERHNADPPAVWRDLLEFLGEQGFEGMAEAMQLLINEGMTLSWFSVKWKRWLAG